MNNKKELITEVIGLMEEEKKTIQKSLNHNLDRIAEINVYLKSLLDKEDSDFKVFSPRNIESIYSDQIATCNREKNSLEAENKIYYSKINELNTTLDKLYIVSSDFHDEIDEIKNVTFNSKTLIVTQEAERQRIARDLHDTSLQNLAAIIHKVELASMYITQDAIRAKLELASVNNSLKDTINEIREIIFDLRPMTFDDLGFKELIDAFIEKETENKSIDIIIDKYNLSLKDEVILMSLFHIFKESFMNSVIHSKCSEIHITIDDEKNNELVFEISDNGVGFNIDEKINENNKHYGLIILQERVKLMQGNIILNSSLGSGTKIHVSIPL